MGSTNLIKNRTPSLFFQNQIDGKLKEKKERKKREDCFEESYSKKTNKLEQWDVLHFVIIILQYPNCCWDTQEPEVIGPAVVMWDFWKRQREKKFQSFWKRKRKKENTNRLWTPLIGQFLEIKNWAKSNFPFSLAKHKGPTFNSWCVCGDKKGMKKRGGGVVNCEYCVENRKIVHKE